MLVSNLDHLNLAYEILKKLCIVIIKYLLLTWWSKVFRMVCHGV